ncbi:MAG: hypothetical protein ACSHWW_07480 [Nonlabens sp.]|uniref:hypothetical protein n=1 Tax=Nonlabens sp. TaxID=1888209 RepID=UPI003EF6E458
MIQYYFSDGIGEFGPFTLNELKTKKLRPDFKIRTEATTFTGTASNIPELDSLFEPAPTPSQNIAYQQPQYVQPEVGEKSKSDKLLITALIIWLSTLLLNGLISFIFRNSFSSDYHYVFLGIVNLLSAALPLLVALSIKDKNLKVIGIVIAVILTLRFVFGAIQLMTFSIF